MTTPLMPTRHNPDASELLRRLLLDRSGLGAAPADRAAVVRNGVESTYVVPGDFPRHAGDKWFLPGAPVTEGDAVYLIDGPRTFRAMVEAIETADSEGHFIVLLGWSLDAHFPLDERGRSFLDIITERARLKVAVRVLLYDNTDMWTFSDDHGRDTDAPHRVVVNASMALNRLRTDHDLDVYCNLDDNTNGWIPGGQTIIAHVVPERAAIHSYGSQHHKVLAVHGRDGLIAFCGGIDIDPNRACDLHDVHLRVTGTAVPQLLEMAEQRWLTSRDDGRPPLPPTLSIPPYPPPAPSDPAPYRMQVVQTVGTPELLPKIPNTLWPAVRHAVRTASRFIYIEDQYFMSLDLIDELVAAAERVQHITILLPGAIVTEPISWNLRQNTLRALVRSGGSGIEKKIGVYCRNPGAHECVHSKLFIFDDEYAFVGSANANNRGYFLDSEANIGIADRPWDDPKGSRAGVWYHREASFARRLRIELWREHLGLPAAELYDGVGARAHWLSLPPSAHVSPYMAINIHKCREAGRRYHADLGLWKRRKALAAMAQLPFDEDKPATPVGPTDQAPWNEAPYAEWAAYPTAEDAFLDPKQ